MTEKRNFDESDWRTGSMSVAHAKVLIARLSEYKVLRDLQSVDYHEDGLEVEKSEYRAFGWIEHHGFNDRDETFVYIPKNEFSSLAYFASKRSLD